MASRFTFGKTALVTGASRGLGRAFAERLAAEGLAVFGTTRNPAQAPIVEGVHWLEADFGDAEGLALFCERHAGLLAEVDVLVNNAGFADFGPFEAAPTTAFEVHWRVMVGTPVRLAQAVVEPMRGRRNGAIVNVASLAVELPLPYLAFYNTAKAGLAGFSQSLMLELRGSGVQITDFRPGDYRTGFYEVTSRHGATNDERAEVWRKMQAHVAAGPLPRQAADDLLRCLQRGRSGTVRSGTWFQSRLAPVATRILPGRVMRKCILRYYGLKGR